MNTMDYMISLANQKTEKDDDEYMEIERRYVSAFGHAVPREMLPTSLSKAELLNAMKRCVDSNTDNIFEVLGIEINPEHLY